MRVFFFSSKEVIWAGLHAFCLGNVPTGAALATCLSHGNLCLNLDYVPFSIATSPYRLSWPWEHARGHVMSLATCPIGVSTLALATCPMERLFSQMMVFSKRFYLFFLPLMEVIWASQHRPWGSMPTGAEGLCHGCCLGYVPFPLLLPP